MRLSASQRRVPGSSEASGGDLCHVSVKCDSSVARPIAVSVCSIGLSRTPTVAAIIRGGDTGTSSANRRILDSCRPHQPTSVRRITRIRLLNRFSEKPHRASRTCSKSCHAQIICPVNVIAVMTAAATHMNATKQIAVVIEPLRLRNCSGTTAT